ncbi:Hypothetical predicted protein [Paramuricea clavata]|uniref:Uncharacterized protein n=1 Tax=Paramuricea clavata TaxID=317549 RepID=A0A7D9H9F9_PARCT|nr:Hypothetical predicted protein [Paramuricea clavata]
MKLASPPLPSLLPKATTLESEHSLHMKHRGKITFEGGHTTTEDSRASQPSTSTNESIAVIEERPSNIEESQPSTSKNIHGACSNCALLLKRNKQLKSNWLSAKHKLDVYRKEMESHSNAGNEDIPPIKKMRAHDFSSPTVTSDVKDVYSSDVGMPASNDVYEEETEESTETEAEDETIPQHKKIFLDNSNLRREPKFIVFFTQLLALFKFCHSCQFDHPLVEVQENGTMAEVTTTCANPKCGKTSKWFSQPYLTGTMIPAGNFLLSFAILVAYISHQNLESIQAYQIDMGYSIASEKMHAALTNKRLMNGIKQASPFGQTSCLEGMHPAVIHFNNLNRKNRMKNGVEQVHVVYPKFKNGEAVVRNLKVQQNFDYVDEIYDTIVDAMLDKKLAKEIKELKDETPPPMNRMLEKQRESMPIVDVPPTIPEYARSQTNGCHVTAMPGQIKCFISGCSNSWYNKDNDNFLPGNHCKKRKAPTVRGPIPKPKPRKEYFKTYKERLLKKRLEKNQVDFDNLKEQLHDLEEKLASEKDKEKEMNEKLRKYVDESEVLQNKINQQQFGYEKFISDDSKMIFYTGLSRKQFYARWEFIEAELSTPIRKEVTLLDFKRFFIVFLDQWSPRNCYAWTS